MTRGFMSRRKTISAVFLAVVLIVPFVQGDEAPAVSTDFKFASRYVFRGVERAGPSAQGGVALGFGDFSGGLWVNQPLQSGQTQETKLNASWTWKPAAQVGLEFSAAHSWFSEVPGGGAKRSAEAGLTATFAGIAGFTPGLAYQHDFHFRADTLQASLARSIALTKLGAFLELNCFAGAAQGANWQPDSAGPARRDGYSFWGGEARLPYRVGPHSTVTAGVHYAEAAGRSPANGPIGLAASRNFWVTLGVNLDF